MLGAIFIGVPPMLLLGLSAFRGETEHILGMSSFAFGVLLIVAGFVAYGANSLLKPQGWSSVVDESVQSVG
jgi:hypothetical protein